MTGSYTKATQENNLKNGVSEDAYDLALTDFLTLKTLEAKRLHRFGSPHGANAHTVGFSNKKELVRNLCVRVDALRLAELDALMEVLRCNKQEFVVEVIFSAIEQAKAQLKSAGLRSAFDEVLDRKIADAGFQLHQEKSGYWSMSYKDTKISNAAVYEEDSETS